MSEKPDGHELRARMLRLLAAGHRKRAAELDLAAEAAQAARSMRRLSEVITKAEAREIAEHPDLAELAAQLRGFYGDDTANPGELPTS